MNNVHYDWAGSTIVFDTFVDRCRWIIKDSTVDDMHDGSPRLFVRTDVRDLIVPSDNWEMKEIVEQLRITRGLPAERNNGTFDERAIICWKWTVETITYSVDALS